MPEEWYYEFQVVSVIPVSLSCNSSYQNLFDIVGTLTCYWFREQTATKQGFVDSFKIQGISFNWDLSIFDK